MLSALAIDNAKPREKPYKLSDGNGLHLLVNPNGSKLWRLRYRFGGKQLMLSLGLFPDVSLASARTKRDDARKLIAAGKDPSQQRKLDKLAGAEAAKNTFGVIAEEHLEQMKADGAAETTLRKVRWMLTDLAAALKDRPITEITSAEVLQVLRVVEKSGRRETARKLRGKIGKIFRIAIASLRATNDPTYALRDALAAPIVTHRPAITDEARLGALMVAIDEYDGWPTLRASLLFIALTMMRPGEVRKMRRSEVIWPKSIWRVPAERMKMRRPLDIPLSKQALKVLRDIWPLSEGHELVFPSIRSLRKPLSDNAMNSALRRMGYAGDEHCAHGFRTSASTILNERFPEMADAIEVALAHQDEDAPTRPFAR